MYFEIQMTGYFPVQPKSLEEAHEMYDNGQYEIDSHDIIMFGEKGDMIGFG